MGNERWFFKKRIYKESPTRSFVSTTFGNNPTAKPATKALTTRTVSYDLILKYKNTKQKKKRKFWNLKFKNKINTDLSKDCSVTVGPSKSNEPSSVNSILSSSLKQN